MSHHETIEVPSMEEFNALGSDVAALRAQLGAFANLQGWLKFITDAKACSRRADELSAIAKQAIESLGELEAGRAELAAAKTAQEAQLAARARAVVDREEAVSVREEAVAAEYAGITGARAMVERETELLKSRLMHYGGIVRQPLQDSFSFEQVENLLHGRRQDAHFDGNEGTPREQGGLGVEDPPDMVRGSTLTRSTQHRGARPRVGL
jgi:hypothetical protein